MQEKVISIKLGYEPTATLSIYENTDQQGSHIDYDLELGVDFKAWPVASILLQKVSAKQLTSLKNQIEEIGLNEFEVQAQA